MYKDYLNLTKPRLTMLNIFAALFGFLLAGKNAPTIYLVESIFYISLVVAGAGALNCLMEIDLDSQMDRTKSRPLPAGRLTPKAALLFGSLLILVGSLGLLIRSNLLTGVISLSSAIFYLVFYTPMKIRSPYAVFVGAIPGALPPVIGFTAASGEFTNLTMTLFLILFAWQIPHFLAISVYSRDDYSKAGVVVYPNSRSILYTVKLINFFTSLTVVCSLLPVILGVSSNFYGFVAVLLGLCFQVICLKGYRSIGKIDIENSWAKKCFFASIIYLPLLLISMFIL